MRGRGSAEWRSDFVGVAYRYYDLRMNIALLYEERRAATDLWHDVIRWWSDPSIRVRFVESGDSYWIAVAAESRRPESNPAFCRLLPRSENYERFKRGHGGEAFLRLGIYSKMQLAGAKDDDVCACGHEAADHGGGRSADAQCRAGSCACEAFSSFKVTLLRKKKTVTDIAFVPIERAKDDSLAWNCISQGGRL